MPRPFLLRVLPDRISASLFARVYRPRARRYSHLYNGASLRFAPSMTMDLVVGDQISDEIAFLGYYELALSEHIVALAQRGGLMVDVGANLGTFSLLWIAGHPQNHSVAVEVSPRNLPLLRRNIEQNGASDRIEVRAVAAGAECGALPFTLGEPSQTGWGGFLGDRKHPDMITVPVLPIDDMVPEGERIALLKIDIEGADTLALQGCERLLRSRAIDEIWYEQNQPRMQALGISFDAAREFLASVGYVTTPLGDPRQPLCDWRAVPG